MLRLEALSDLRPGTSCHGLTDIDLSAEGERNRLQNGPCAVLPCVGLLPFGPERHAGGLHCVDGLKKRSESLPVSQISSSMADV